MDALLPLLLSHAVPVDDDLGRQVTIVVVLEGLQSTTYASVQLFLDDFLKPMYNKVSGIPPITLIVVNKRINQRIFIKDQHGNRV